MKEALGGSAYGAMIEVLRDLLDKVAGARPDQAALAALAGDLRAWSGRLTTAQVDEREQVFGRLPQFPGRGQTMSPAYVVVEEDATSVRATVTFGRYFLGSRGAVHGGAIPLLVDEIMGRLANGADRPRARTAYLNTNYRALTPVGAELAVSAWIVSEIGRKLVLRAELRHGDTLCADAEGLFVIVRPGQDLGQMPAAE